MGPAIGAGAPSIIRIQFRGTLSAPCLKDDGLLIDSMDSYSDKYLDRPSKNEDQSEAKALLLDTLYSHVYATRGSWIYL